MGYSADGDGRRREKETETKTKTNTKVNRMGAQAETANKAALRPGLSAS